VPLNDGRIDHKKRVIKRPLAWRAHLENYAELYERALKTPAPAKKGLNSRQRAKARSERIARHQQYGRTQ
jgi:hypothetical protein